MMMKKLFLIFALTLCTCQWAAAQRFTDNLGRGLVAVPVGAAGNSNANMVTWRRLADEYYGVTYNLYKNGARIASGLTTTCYHDAGSAPASTRYEVAAVADGVEQAKCDAVTPWAQYVYQYSVRCPTGFLDIALAAVYDRNGNDVTDHYEPNDAEMADLDGDGQLEIIIKRLNTVDAANVYPQGNTTEFVVLDAYDVDWQTGEASLMWRVDCGPNMVSLNSTEINIIAYDWDEDGRAEVVMRGADNMMVYGSDGRSRLYTIGNMAVNTRGTFNPANGSQYAWTHTGAEYLLYMNGQTGALYQKTDFPLKRLESGETSLKAAWGDDYGHRCSKYFLGAPFLDGRTASLFLARGIYTRHKMMAMDLNRASHTWSPRWTWTCNNSSSPWYGNGYHNFVIADVDEDGRDEIVYGSMVIDDCGRGLSTTALGHGDAQHVSDFDPYRPGLEFFGCNEDQPAMNYRNATTGQLYVRTTSGSDDGRALMANFSNEYPGSVGRSVSSPLYSSVSDQPVGAMGGDSFIAWGDLNFRIYFDGDLCSEILNSPGTAREAKIEKPGTGRLFTSSGCNMNNDSKNNPCFQGDIIGDWREEIVVRCGRNLRVYTTGIGTGYSLPSLWFDHQYRQAMVWQMMAYNQPPHLSYFLGELEGITVAPPPLTMQGRTEVADGGTIGTALNGRQVLVCGSGSASGTFTVAAGAQPSVLIVNTPMWVQGNDNNQLITTTTFTHTLNGAALSGSTRLTKQGGGTLKLNGLTHTHSGNTDVWGGTLEFNGTLQNSALWLNRFTTLRSGGTFAKGIAADYGATIIPGGENAKGTIAATTLTMNHGARLLMDVYSDFTADKVDVSTLAIHTKSGANWEEYGPQYLTPVVEIAAHGSLPDGTYDLGTIGTLAGDIADIVVEGVSGATLQYVSGHLCLVVGDGVATFCPEPVIAESGLLPTGEGILLPAVDITAPSFSYKGEMVTPSLSATFTDTEGNRMTADIMKTIYGEDYENATAVTGWTNSGAPMSIASGDAGYGNYLAVNTATTNTRYAYQRLNGVDVSDVSVYAVEFDLAVVPGNTDPVEFCVMSKGGKNPSNNWDNYAAINGNANMLFDITAPKSSTTFSVNGTETTTTLASGAWHHYTLLVDRENRIVTWSISNGSKGTFSLPTGTSADIDGFYLVAGRYYSSFKLDNIHIGGFGYTFTEPGLLTVTSSNEGCSSVSTDYEAGFVGVSIGSDGWTTLGCRYPLVLTEAGLEAAFIATGQKNGMVGLTAVESVPASTGLLLNGAAGIYRLHIADGAEDVGTNMLYAVTDTQGYTVASNDIYMLDNGNVGVGFYLCRQGVTVPVGKAYLQFTGNGQDFVGFEEAITDAIDVTPSAPQSSMPWYTPAGVRVSQPKKGLYIRGHQKVVIK